MAALEGEVKHLKGKIRGHQFEVCEFDKKVSESREAQEGKEHLQHLHDQLLLNQQQVRKLS